MHELCDTMDFRGDLTTLAVPVHLFAGQQDRITDLAQIQEWFGLLECPAKRLEIVEDAVHLNLYEQLARSVASWSRSAPPCIDAGSCSISRQVAWRWRPPGVSGDWSGRSGARCFSETGGEEF